MKRFWTMLLAALMCLAMLLPAQAESLAGEIPAMEFAVRDAVLTLNGEDYDLGFDAYFAVAPADDTVLAEFYLTDDSGTRYLPGRLQLDGDGITGELDGMSGSLTASYGDLWEKFRETTGIADPAVADELKAMLAEYAELMGMALEMSRYGQSELVIDIDVGNYIDRGEPTVTASEDGATVEEYAYTLGKEELADLFAAALAEENNPQGPALEKYLNAYIDFIGIELPEGRVVQYLREAPFSFEADCVEVVVEAQGRGWLSMDAQITAGDVEVSVLISGIYDASGSSWAVTAPSWGGASLALTMDTTHDETGTTQTVDLAMTMPEAEEIPTDVGDPAPEADTYGLDAPVDTEETAGADAGLSIKSDMFSGADEEDVIVSDDEEAALGVIGGADDAGDSAISDGGASWMEKISSAKEENDSLASGDEMGSVGIIGGADGPTEVFVASAPTFEELNLHAEYFLGTPDENGTSECSMTCTYDLDGFVGMEMGYAGTITRDGTSVAEDVDMGVSVTMSGITLGFAAALECTVGGEPELSAPAADAVDLISGDSAELETLTAELEAVLKEGMDMIMAGGLSDMIADLVMQSYDADYEENYYEEAEDFYSVEDLETYLGCDLPLEDQIGDLAFANAMSYGGSVSVTYASVDEETYTDLSLYLYESTQTEYYTLDENGGFAPLNAGENDLMVQVYEFDGEEGYCSFEWEIAPGMQANAYLYSTESFSIEYVMDLIHTIQYGE